MFNDISRIKCCIAALILCISTSVFAADKPNILVIWGDDIGPFNISAYNMGLMGYRTPNIDRIAQEGILFTDSYGEQSCTAGRSAFITGQHPMRTGLTKVGLPGARQGLQKEDPTIATLLKPLGYMTGQFGKNHLGDLDEHLPTNHGFDEFFGNLYHLNAEDEPEHPDYPKDPTFKKRFGPRGSSNRLPMAALRTPVRSTRNAWKQSMKSSSRRHYSLLIAPTPPTNHSLCGLMLRACMSGPDSSQSHRASPDRACMPMV